MTILRAHRAPVKPTRRSPLPSSPFGVGILPANVLEPTTDELVDLATAFTVPVTDHSELDWMSELDPTWSIRPDVDGSGLSAEEFSKVTQAGYRARAAYRQDAPEAPADELDRVEMQARRDALRSVLKRRPAASVTISDTDGVIEMITPGVLIIDTPDWPTMDEMSTDGPVVCVTHTVEPAPCCDDSELAPCLGCAAEHFVGAEKVMAEPPRPQRWTPRPASEAEPLLSLAELVEAEADRIRARGNAAYDLMARSLDELARVVRTVDAMVPADVDARLELLEREFTAPVEYEPELTSAGRWA